MGKSLLERALEAQEENDKLRERVADLESRLKAALNADPSTASRALSWIGRAEQAETLVRQVLLFVKQRSLDTTHFPPGWVARAEAQIKTVEVLERDLRHLAERPPDDDYWTTFDDPKGRPGVVRDSDGWMHRRDKRR